MGRCLRYILQTGGWEMTWNENKPKKTETSSSCRFSKVLIFQKREKVKGSLLIFWSYPCRMMTCNGNITYKCLCDVKLSKLFGWRDIL